MSTSDSTLAGAQVRFERGDVAHGAWIDPEARIRAGTLVVEPGVSVGPGVRIAGDTVHLGRGVRVGPGCDLRASELRLEEGTEVDRDVRVLVADRFVVGPAGRFSRGVEITCRRFEAGRLLFLGHRLAVGYGGTTESTATVSLGNRVALGPHGILNANCPIRMDDQVGSGCNLAVWTHGFHFGHSPLEGHGVAFEPVHVERNVWLGFQVTLLPGVRIGENTIVASGAVVTRDLPADVIAAGVPAAPRRPLNPVPLADDMASRLLVSLLRQWAGELRWKGLSVEETTEGDLPRLLVEGEDGLAVVAVVPVGHTFSMEPAPGSPRVLVAVDPEPLLRAGLRDGWTLLAPRSQLFVGASTPLAEDLRDYLRRHAMPCGDHAVFRSIEPSPFARLREML